MNIRTSLLGQPAARDAYLKRYRRIGAQHAPRTRHTDIGPGCELLVDGFTADGGQYVVRLPHPSVREKQKLTGRTYDLALGSKPNHAARAVALPLIHLGVRPRPKQPEHPATAPMTEWHRRGVYAEQAGHRDPNRLTPRQARRVRHKARRAWYAPTNRPGATVGREAAYATPAETEEQS